MPKNHSNFWWNAEILHILFPFNFVTGIANSTIDAAAIFGIFETENEEELKFINNMNDIFFTFVKTGLFPKGEDLSFDKMLSESTRYIFSKDRLLPFVESPVLTKAEDKSFMFLMNFNSSLSSVSQVPIMIATSIGLSTQDS